jgi:hypothetical protein
MNTQKLTESIDRNTELLYKIYLNYQGRDTNREAVYGRGTGLAAEKMIPSPRVESFRFVFSATNSEFVNYDKVVTSQLLVQRVVLSLRMAYSSGYADAVINFGYDGKVKAVSETLGQGDAQFYVPALTHGSAVIHYMLDVPIRYNSARVAFLNDGAEVGTNFSGVDCYGTLTFMGE